MPVNLSIAEVLDSTTTSLTCDTEGGVLAAHDPRLVASLAPVHSAVRLLLAVDDPEEEQAAGRQYHPVASFRPQRPPVLEPAHHGLGSALCVTVEGRRLVPGHQLVGGVLGDTRCSDLAWNRRQEVSRSGKTWMRREYYNERNIGTGMRTSRIQDEGRYRNTRQFLSPYYCVSTKLLLIYIICRKKNKINAKVL